MRETCGRQGTDRREFLKGLASAGVLYCLWPSRILAQNVPAAKDAGKYAFDFKFRSTSVEHLREVREWLAKLDAEGKLSHQKEYREIIGQFDYSLPKTLPKARSILVVAYLLRPATVTFHLGGKACIVVIPSGYADDGVPEEAITERIKREALQDPRSKIEMAGAVPQKTIAVRCGLAEYGKNNITFVEGFGSFHQVLTYFTEEKLPDHWGPLKMMRLCKGCSICPKACPTQCIREENFVVDVGRCITLYNERAAPLPDWIDAKAHHTLVGCVKCQFPCPANQDFLKNIDNIADVTEEETAFLLSGKRDEKIEKPLIEKLARWPSAKNIPYFSRNLKLALANAVPT